MLQRAVLGLILCLVATSFSSQAQSSKPVTEAVLSLAGDIEIVFDWTTDRCDDEDIPDLPARAFHDSSDQVQLISTHFVARRSIGPTLDQQTRDCAVVAESVSAADPALYSDKEWLASLYTEDGSTIYALQHNEYQGHTHRGQCPSGEYFNCWYNAITLAVSTDGGASYRNVTQPPQHLVASLPYQYEAEAGPYGIFEPSNMIRAADGYIYAFVRVDDYRSSRQWTCLMRTDKVADPRSWHAWDGSGFNLSFANPYTEIIDRPASQRCAPVAEGEIGVMHESVTYNTYLDQYVLVGNSADQINGRETWGVYYAFSNDLIHWSHRQLLMETEFPWTFVAGDHDPILYPSLLDPDSASRNFETTDQHAYLYFTQFNYTGTQMTLDRDLVRIPVEFNAITIDAPAYEFTFSGQVPANATGALVGYRINTECDCLGTADFTLYTVRYTEAGDTRNLVPNAVFAGGMSSWHAWGDARYGLEPSDLSAGQMLHVTAEDSQIAGLNGQVFPVTAGADFTVTFVARVLPETADAGYFTIIFVDNRGEVRRERITLGPNV